MLLYRGFFGYYLHLFLYNNPSFFIMIRQNYKLTKIIVQMKSTDDAVCDGIYHSILLLIPVYYQVHSMYQWDHTIRM